jgi:hypothetical protein
MVWVIFQIGKVFNIPLGLAWEGVRRFGTMMGDVGWRFILVFVIFYLIFRFREDDDAYP